MVFEKRHALVRTKRTWLLVAQFVAVLPEFGLMPWLVSHDGYYFVASMITTATVMVLALAWLRWLQVRFLDVRADATGLYLGGRLACARASIPLAHTIRDRGMVVVRVARAFRPTEIVVEDEQEAGALTAALRLDEGHSVVRLWMTDGTIARALARGALGLATCVVGIGSVLFFYSAGPGPTLVASAIFVSGLLVLLARGNLTLSVGADGVHVRRWLGGARFVRYSDIQRVTTNRGTVSLELRNDSTLMMSHGGRARAVWLLGRDTQNEAEAIFTRVASQVEIHRVRELASSIHALLARGARPTERWLGALRVCSDASASFRAAAIPPDVLWSVVEDTTAPPSSRVGAAVALRGTLDHAATARLTRAAEACAAPRIRVALERVARANDDVGFTSALDMLDAEDATGHDPASVRAYTPVTASPSSRELSPDGRRSP